MPMDRISGLATIITFMSEEHIFTYLLSSPFTARNLVVEKGDVEEVKKDLMLSVILSIVLSIVAGVLVHEPMVALLGTIFGFVLYYVYAVRGGLL